MNYPSLWVLNKSKWSILFHVQLTWRRPAGYKVSLPASRLLWTWLVFSDLQSVAFGVEVVGSQHGHKTVDNLRSEDWAVIYE